MGVGGYSLLSMAGARLLTIKVLSKAKVEISKSFIEGIPLEIDKWVPLQHM